MSGATLAGDGFLFLVSMIALTFLCVVSPLILARLVPNEIVFPEWFRRGPQQ